MAMSRQAPGWITWALAAGLILLFLGERVLGHLPTARLSFSIAGAWLVVMATAWRAVSFASSHGAGRRVERILLLGSVGCVAALLLYLVSSDDGMRWLSFTFSEAKTRERWQGVLAVLWPILLACSLSPLVFAKWALGAARGGEVEAFRVSEATSSALTVALAGSMLFVLNYVASERDHKVDLSYFRTSMPGSATRNMVASLKEPLKVLVFFPEVNEVKDEVKSYFNELAKHAGRVQLESHDRMVSAKLAKEYRVSKDGTVVLVNGTQSESISLSTEIQEARRSLRTFDEQVQKAFMKVARGSRVAYLTVGHGELNDPGSEGIGAEGLLAGASAIRQILGVLNYKVNDLGLKEGLGQDVPEDAAIVLALGPKKPFLDEELRALDRYLQRGGSLFMALDPAGEAALGPLEARLGVRFDRTPLENDEAFIVRRNNPSDHRLIITDQFSAHASVTTLSRSRVGAGILLVGSGSIADAPAVAEGEAMPKRTHVVRSLSSTYADKNDNNAFDPDEKRESYNLVTAIEGAAPAQPVTAQAAAGKGGAKEDGKDKRGKAMRALVLADAEMLSDSVLMQVGLNAALFHDGVKWLGGEEQFTGETKSEKDVAIEHTKSQDVAWFYGTIICAPLVVLTGGLLSVVRRRRTRRRS
ncbi:MAG: Gldg family protein [Deltaproteobacteria bacterium]|nr:Gldg family protein [Deltaproteobacteria bacterium]